MNGASRFKPYISIFWIVLVNERLRCASFDVIHGDERHGLSSLLEHNNIRAMLCKGDNCRQPYRVGYVPRPGHRLDCVFCRDDLGGFQALTRSWLHTRGLLMATELLDVEELMRVLPYWGA